MPVRDFICNDGFKNFHGAQDSQDTVVISAVFYGVAVGRHCDPLQSRLGTRNSSIYIRHIIRFDFGSDGLHSSYKFIPCHMCFGRQGIPGDPAMASVAEFAESLDFIFHPVFITSMHC
ncbi:hypothetical protein SDC9_154779 [bioreactor metagenome]|uniref:Uncharacterized protein n=1 Tax=bioreactor metagenome TaxID=1076179 RepID=A0A645F256_9ZZZZ